MIKKSMSGTSGHMSGGFNEYHFYMPALRIELYLNRYVQLRDNSTILCPWPFSLTLYI